MAESAYSLDNFRSEVLSSAGLARTNRFEVMISPPSGYLQQLGVGPNTDFLASLYVEQASIPLLNIFSKPFKIFGPTYQRPITSEYGGEGISLTFHVDREMKIRRFFEDWMHLVVDPDTFTVGYQQDYASTINIRQLDDENNIVYEVQLLEAFPRNLNIMELNNASSNQTHRLNVLFAYRYWRNLDRDNTQSEVVPRALTDPQVPSFDVRTPEFGKQWNWTTGELDYSPGSDLPPAA